MYFTKNIKDVFLHLTPFHLSCDIPCYSISFVLSPIYHIFKTNHFRIQRSNKYQYRLFNVFQYVYQTSISWIILIPTYLTINSAHYKTLRNKLVCNLVIIYFPWCERWKLLLLKLSYVSLSYDDLAKRNVCISEKLHTGMFPRSFVTSQKSCNREHRIKVK